MTDLQTRIQQRIKELEPETVANRRHIHELAELSNTEVDTSAFVEGKLREYGFEDIHRPTEFSVVAILDTGREGKKLALRADLDALAVPESEENLAGPIVRESVGDSLKKEETAAITSYFRHISESFLPTYTTIFIALTFTNGRVTAPAFILAMLPMIAALFFVGWLVYLRRIPRETGDHPEESKGYYVRLLMRSVWMIILTIALILLLELPVEAAVFVSIIVNIFVNHFSVGELIPFFRSAFETRLILNTWLIMIFKEILTATGVIQSLPEFFSTLPIPAFLVFALIFFLGTIVAGSQAMIVLCMSMAMGSVAPGHTGLAMFVLMMCMNYIAMQLSPTHICLTICAEDFSVSLGDLVKKTVPLVLVFTVISFLYYGILYMAGF